MTSFQIDESTHPRTQEIWHSYCTDADPVKTWQMVAKLESALQKALTERDSEFELREVLAKRLEKQATLLRHWREQCGKLSAQVAVLKEGDTSSECIKSMARATVAHWHEFGPESGFSEQVDALDAVLSGKLFNLATPNS